MPTSSGGHGHDESNDATPPKWGNITRFLESGSVARDLLSVVGSLELRRRDVTDRLEEPPMVEPVDPLERRVLDVVDALPRTTPADEFGLVQPDDRLGEGVIERVAAAAHRGHGAGLGQALGVADRQVLGTPVAVMDEPVEPLMAGPEGPLPGGPPPGGPPRPRGLPPPHESAVPVDHGGPRDETRPGRPPGPGGPP